MNCLLKLHLFIVEAKAPELPHNTIFHQQHKLSSTYIAHNEAKYDD